MSKQSFCGCGDKDDDGCKHFQMDCAGNFYCVLGNRIRYYPFRSNGTYGYFSMFKCDDHIFCSSPEPERKLVIPIESSKEAL